MVWAAMLNWKSLWLLPAFVAVFFLVGIPFWNIPYSKVSVPNSLVAPGLVGLIAFSLILTVFEVASLRRIFVVMSLCLPALVYARVEVETGRDPTSHNLWPFEIVLALLLGIICVLPALLIGKFALRWVRKGAS